MSAPLTIDKCQVPVEVRDSRGAQLIGEMYVGTEAGAPETLQEALGARRFVPLRTPDGAVRLVNRDQLQWVRVDLLTALDELDAAAEDDSHSSVARVNVLMDDGSSIDGTVRYLRPSDSKRLSDFLQSARSFFAVRTADHVYLLSTAHVVSVAPIMEVAP